jgi:hypothetical protein
VEFRKHDLRRLGAIAKSSSRIAGLISMMKITKSERFQGSLFRLKLRKDKWHYLVLLIVQKQGGHTTLRIKIKRTRYDGYE